jgi:hypothetical protein
MRLPRDWSWRAYEPPAKNVLDTGKGDNFQAPIEQTLGEIDYELSLLSASDISLATAHTRQTRAGNPDVGAAPSDRGVLLEYYTDAGHYQLPSRRYARWQANLRAIYLTLEALRGVDRWGVGREGAQYTGYAALPPGDQPSGIRSREQAAFILVEASSIDIAPAALLNAPELLPAVIRAARAAVHPDRIGDSPKTAEVDAAAQYIQEARP